MIILGIDPGESRIGFGIVEKKGSSLRLVDHGCIMIPPSVGDAARKLTVLEEKLGALIEAYRPAVAGVEMLFFVKNQKTGIRVAQARGVILLVCARMSVRIREFTPLQIKLAVTGYGSAEKKQVQKMVGAILGLHKPLTQDDAADAVAAAICASQELPSDQ